MLFIPWNEKYEIGIDELDRQHRDLVGQANELHKALSKSANKEQIKSAIRGMEEFVRVHFADEEWIMEMCQYPAREEHYRSHELMKKEATDFLEALEKDRIPAPNQVLDTLRDWILEHIGKEDSEFGRFLKSEACIEKLPFIIWTSEYVLSDHSANEFHHELINSYDHLVALTAFGKSSDRVEYALEEIMTLAGSHFQMQESIMEQIMYPHYEEHRQDHLGLLEQRSELCRMLANSDPGGKLRALEYISEWINEHIKRYDRRYIEYVNFNEISPDTIYVRWDRTYGVDIEEMDSQHKRILTLVNKIHDAENAENGHKRIPDLLNSIQNEFKGHFFAEEALMRKVKYPGLIEHKKHHDLLLKQILEIQKKLVLGKSVSSINLAEFLRDWTINHIKKHDQSYGQYFRTDAINSIKLFANWDPDFTVHNEKIDAQHKHLIHLLNKIHSAMTLDKDFENVGRLLDELVRKTRQHFDTEYELLHKYGYHDMDKHKTEHQRLLKQVKSLQIWSKSGRSLTAMKDLRLIRSWLLDHIRYLDAGYAKFIRKHLKKASGTKRRELQRT